MARLPTNKELVWKKADVLENKDPSMWRIDLCGALINWREFGKRTKYGWNVDHIFPKAEGGTDHIFNLCAMHWKNNQDKADNFPKFRTTISFNGTKNVKFVKEQELDASVLEKLRQVYVRNKKLDV
jgi:hypothetical protein